MKARDTISVSALRSLIGALDNASAVPAGPAWPPVVNKRADVPRRELSEKETLEIIEREAVELSSAVRDYESRGQSAQGDELRAKLAVISRYLDD